jgi:glycosyltransferase involved in cell wall biosynthesis
MKAVDRPESRSTAVAGGHRALLLHVFHSFGCGGAQTRFVQIANHFGVQLRHVVIAMNGDYSGMSAFAREATVTALAAQASKGFSLQNVAAIRSSLQTIDPDILVTHNWGTMNWVLSRFISRVRHIHIEDGFGPDEANGLKRRRTLARQLLLRRSEVVVPSANLERIARTRWKIDSGRLHFIPNGIDCARFSRFRGSGSTAIRDGALPVVGTVAALRAEKNLARLLRAFALASLEHPCRLVIAGDGPERRNLEALSAELGLRDKVTFLGHVEDTSPLYRTFDVFALTSDTEQMPYTVLEAMAAGNPVVATDVGDVRSMVSPENAPLIVNRDDQDVAAAILLALRDRSSALRIGEANEVRARRQYDQSLMFEAFWRLYGFPATRNQDQRGLRA